MPSLAIRQIIHQIPLFLRVHVVLMGPQMPRYECGRGDPKVFVCRYALDAIHAFDGFLDGAYEGRDVHTGARDGRDEAAAGAVACTGSWGPGVGGRWTVIGSMQSACHSPTPN
jgi:hypothetical protein